MEQLVATEPRFLSRRQARARRGDTADNQAASIDASTLDTSSEHENRDKTTIDMLERVKVPKIVRMEEETNQDTTKPLSWDDFMGNGCGLPYQHEKTKDQQSTTAGKIDDADFPAAKTTATFTSSCESEWNEYMSDVMMEPRTLSDHISMDLEEEYG